MATAIIPIISAAAPLLTPLIHSLVTQVEHLFGAKTGPTKFDLVLQSVTTAAEKLATAGKIPGQIDSAIIATMIQTLVSQLNANGVLTPENAAQAVAKGGVVGVAGTGIVPTVLNVVGGSLQLAIPAPPSAK